MTDHIESDLETKPAADSAALAGLQREVGTSIDAKLAIEVGRESELAAKSAANLSGRLREVETEYEAGDDVVDLRAQLVAGLRINSKSHYRLGEILYRYREALPRGAWTPVVEAIVAVTNYGDRTIREIVADYERVESLPAPVVVALEQSGIDPAAKGKAKVVAIAVERYSQGHAPVEAVHGAVQAARKKTPPLPGTVKATKEEKLIYQVRLGIRRGLERVPQNLKLEYGQIGMSEELTAMLGDGWEPFAVSPKKPTLDLMGNKWEDDQ